MYSITCNGEPIANDLTAPQASAAFCNFTAGDADGNYEIAQSTDEENEMNENTISTQHDKETDTYTVTQRDRAGDWSDRPLLLDEQEALTIIRRLVYLVNVNTSTRIDLTIHD